ncbi:exported protein of unknown function [Modestobacter italicus]|uniref:Uncharacterized protein n=1 Tax=Modestobacter italicus (strain DSM 44449 / CECT 9708 / BC 501) TaxID=2732864 RepID=I4EVE5_MODI5|nr:exported protein of unknown function [Modestobacter marinus]
MKFGRRQGRRVHPGPASSAAETTSILARAAQAVSPHPVPETLNWRRPQPLLLKRGTAGQPPEPRLANHDRRPGASSRCTTTSDRQGLTQP